jgi:membrane protein
VARAGLDVGRRLGSLVGAVAGRVIRHGQTGRASQFSYNAFVATVPLLFVLVSILGLAGSQATYEELIEEFSDSIPDEVETILLGAVRSATGNTGSATIFLLLGAVTGLWLAGNVMGTLVDGINDAYEHPGRPWVRSKVIAIGFAAGWSLILIAATVVLVGGPALVQSGAEEIGLGSGAQTLGRWGIYTVGAAFLVVFLALLYRYGPTYPEVRYRQVVVGTAVATLGWFGATQVFSLYVNTVANYNVLYGSLGAVVVYLIFLYLTGLVILIGAEVNAELAERRVGLRPQP